MDNVRTIYLDWNTGGIVRSDGGAYLARQYDHLSNLMVFRNAPELENYYLIVEMKEDEDDLAARSMEPILLPGPYWLVPNVYTQLVQPVTFQVCCKTESGDFEQHSAKFKLNVIESLRHDGADLDVDPSPMFDAYEDYVDEKVQELIDEAGGISIDTRAYVDQKITEMVAAAGEVIIDSTLSISGAAADAKATGDAISETNERLDIVEADLSGLATFESYNPVVDLKDYPVTQGYLNTSDGSFTATSGAGSYQRTTDPIALDTGVSYTVVFSGHSGATTVTVPRAVCVYRNDDSYSRYISIPIGLTSITLTGNESYIRINYNAQTVDTFNYHPTGQTEPVNTTTLNEDVIIPQTETLETEISAIDTRVTALEQKDDVYIGARRCTIGFIIDGDYDQNAIMENAFYSKGVKIGFAPQYTTSFSNNSKETYLEWQAKGHEILAHSSYRLKDGDYDDTVAKGYIKSAYTTLTGYGFKIYGLIGSSGKIADKYIPTVQKYFRYCASENNHAGSYTGAGAEPCLYFATDAPFHLWRYSMQTSTLQQMKDAVDRAIDTTGLLLFYGHAQSASVDNFTAENVSALLDYIASKSPDISIMTPSEAVNEFYTIRYDDVVS